MQSEQSKTSEDATKDPGVTLRPLEQEDLRFAHSLANNASVMRYWFEEPFETLDELTEIYRRHVHDQRERRFIAIDSNGTSIGLVELVELDHLHRRGEFQIMISPSAQGRGYATAATRKAIHYAFATLNLRKLYLVVDTTNHAAISVYEKCRFVREATLKQEFFSEGTYHDAIRMYMFQSDYLSARSL